MSIFDSFPLMNAYSVNLDWMLKEMKTLSDNMESFMAVNAITYRGVWNIATSYPAYSLVVYDDYAYISVKPVPSGTDISDREYWQIAAPLAPPVMGRYSTLTALKADQMIRAGSVYVTSGCMRDNDGGGSIYWASENRIFNDIRTVEADNGIFLTNITGTNNVMCYGADNTGAADCYSIVNQVQSVFGSVFFPSGTYKLQSIVTNPAGWSAENCVFKFTDSNGFIITDPDIDLDFLAGCRVESAGNCLEIDLDFTHLVRPFRPVHDCAFYGSVSLKGVREMSFHNNQIMVASGKNALYVDSTINLEISGCQLGTQTDGQGAVGIAGLQTLHVQNEGLTITSTTIINFENGVVLGRSLQTVIDSCIIDQCGKTAVKMKDAFSCALTNSYIMARSGTVCEMVAATAGGAWDAKISNCRFVGTGIGLDMYGNADGIYYTRCIISACAFEGCTAEIKLNRVGQTVVEKCTIDHSIVDDGGNYNTFTLNNFNTGATLTGTSGNKQIFNNQGLLTENSGAIVLTGNSQVVSHGLMAAPSVILVSPVNNQYGTPWVTDIGPTTFTIHVAAAPTQVCWSAKVK